ncbi:MAG: molybdopterin cofactor-binding domain-containing protein [Pseudomonadota bacterium]|nr:aldehyde dehydrogenase [Gammaproteobacteria bacterium]MEE2683722.1 molybdopterin cofactor-binding domain-containing protein [Pseudomonadota bacterium]
MKKDIEISRRVFLQSISALAIQVTIPNLSFSQEDLPRSISDNPHLNIWLKINANKTVSLSMGKAELGQGIRTSLAQIAAEELDLDFSRIIVETLDTDKSPTEGRTTGSTSIERSGVAVRMASSEARHILLKNAATNLSSKLDELSVDNGKILINGKYSKLTYWDLLGNKSFDTKISGLVSPKNPENHKIIGTSQKRLDIPAKVFGDPSYVQDMIMPNMLHARMVRSEIDSANLISTQPEAIDHINGIVSVVQDGSFLAVVAEREEQAISGAETLKNVTVWEQFKELPNQDKFPDILRELEALDPEVIFDQQSPSTNIKSSNMREFTANYSRPYIAHAALSPSAAVALWDGNRLTVWSHTQGVFELKGTLSTALSIEESKVRCIHVEGAGCYGHNGADDAGLDAALIAMKFEGRPIKLVWSREDEFRREPYGSATSIKISANLDSSNMISNWDYHHWTCTHSTRPSGGVGAANLYASFEKNNPLPDSARYTLRNRFNGGDRNAIALYSLPQHRVTRHLISENPLRVSALRGLGAHANVFAIESFMDELATEANQDPIDFRIKHLEDYRAIAVLEEARKLANNKEKLEISDNVGRGVGFARYKNTGTYFAVIVDIGVNLNSGAIKVHRAFAAVDPGQIINPDGVKNQIEGGIIQATSWTLKESVKFSTSGIQSTDWITYPILRFTEVPSVEVSLINRPKLASSGPSECAQGPTSAAIANAVSNAINIRIRDLPLSQEKLSLKLNS